MAIFNSYVKLPEGISCHKPILLHLPILAQNKSPCLPVKKSSFFSKFVAKITSKKGTQPAHWEMKFTKDLWGSSI